MPVQPLRLSVFIAARNNNVRGLQQQLGLVKGVPLSPPSDGTGSPTSFDAARAAMCLLKEVSVASLSLSDAP